MPASPRAVTVHADRAWFVADTHFFHHKAAQMRGFDSPDWMNNALINAWSQVVRATDHVFVLGDLSFAGTMNTNRVLGHLPGRLHLVRGNHDKALSASSLERFETVSDLLTVKVQDVDAEGEPMVQRIVCCHFPMLSWDMQHYGAWHLHGHSHGSARYPSPRARLMDVGVDATGKPYRPVSYKEVKCELGALPIASHDYHTPKID